MVVAAADFPGLFQLLHEQGYSVIGPTIAGGAIIYSEISSVSDLPVGYTDEQEAGRYRLKRRGDGALFGYTVGPYSWKRFLFPPAVRLWRASRDEGVLAFTPESPVPPQCAFLGVRACELHAIQIQDRVLADAPFADPTYSAHRARALLIAVNCTQAGNTCFCASMGTGPRVTDGFDLALTELLTPERHDFLVESGSETGAAILAELPQHPADPIDQQAADILAATAASQMGRQMDTAGIRDLVQDNAENPRWQHVAARCVNCANCTMVCPTCFCTTVEDTTDLTGSNAERWRRWDSCFTTDFAHIHGGSVRQSAMSRYRQWMTHKLSTWHDQFGTSGCVGCGRCITWCPVGIDITEELNAIRRGSKPRDPASNGRG
ncbi:MAG: cytochrome C [Gemmatimonas sp. SG8_17]|nr:MAG: cytochrome C [Gemmatimonas sp. SG8_17]